MPDVKCSVANCKYWAEGNNCAAKSIMIDVDQHASSDFSTEFASMDSHEHKDAASSIRNTCCHTFEKK